MIQGHDYIKIGTSVLDYVFRDLAIAYLQRHDLGQIKPEDLEATGMQTRSLRNSSGFSPPQRERRDSGPTPVNHLLGQKARNAARGSMTAAQASRSEERAPRDSARTARMKGFEGDPCPVCGNMTLVRNGTCLKCETCGSTTGCS